MKPTPAQVELQRLRAAIRHAIPAIRSAALAHNAGGLDTIADDLRDALEDR